MVDHIDHVAKLAGIEHVGIGSDSDLNGYDDMPADQRKMLMDSYKSSYAFRDKLDTDGFDHPKKVYDLTEALIRRGYGDSNIEAVLGGNFRRLLGTVWVPAPAKTKREDKQHEHASRTECADSGGRSGPGPRGGRGRRADGGTTSLDEVIVTAQKRSEALADIPMSVSVVRRRGARAAAGRQLPGPRGDWSRASASVSATPGVTRITMRGINTGGVASTVGIYLNDVPFGSSSGLANAAILSGDFDTFDMARVEVLRGPQGTLYGASALGGVIKYVANAPSTDGFEGAAAGLGRGRRGRRHWAMG